MWHYFYQFSHCHTMVPSIILLQFNLSTIFWKWKKKIYYYDNIKYATLCNVVLDNERWKNWFNPAGFYLLKVNDRNTTKMHEICPKLTIKTPEQCHWCCSGVFIVNFKHISHFVLMFLLLTLNMQVPTGKWVILHWYIDHASLIIFYYVSRG